MNTYLLLCVGWLGFSRVTKSWVSWQWFSQVTKSRVEIIAKSPHKWLKWVFTVTHILFNFLTIIYALIGNTNPLKHSSVAHFALFTKDDLFSLGIVTSTQSNLRRHTNSRYCLCEVIFVNCFCLRKLAQRWSSLGGEQQHWITISWGEWGSKPWLRGVW